MTGPLLELHLAHLQAELSGTRTVRRHMIGQLNLVFTAIRQHGWASDLPTRAMFFPENRPKEAKALPSALSEHVMVQLEQPDNLKMKREAPVSIDEELEVHRRAPRQRRCRTARQ